MMDLEIREFSNAIINYINSAPLSIEVKRLVLHDICQKIDVAADGVIKEQIAEREKKEQEAEKAKEKITGADRAGIMKSARMASEMMLEQLEIEEQERLYAERVFGAMNGGNCDEQGV